MPLCLYPTDPIIRILVGLTIGEAITIISKDGEITTIITQTGTTIIMSIILITGVAIKGGEEIITNNHRRITLMIMQSIQRPDQVLDIVISKLVIY